MKKAVVTLTIGKESEAIENFINDPKPKLSYEECKKRFSHWTWKDVAKEYIKELNNN